MGKVEQPKVCGSKPWMTEAVMQQIIRSSDAVGIQGIRSVCKGLREVVDHNLEILRPKTAQIGAIIARFPNVRTLDLSGALLH
jgi:hypothetical protein